MDFEYFKNWAINHLKKQAKKDADVCKAFFLAEIEINKAFGVGTIRTWKGKKYIKGADKKWRPYYEHNSRGKKMAVAAIIRQINNLQDGDLKGLWQIIKNNKSRFVNENGKPENEVIALYKMIKDKGGVGNGKFKNENKETRLSLLREDFHKEMKKYVGKEFKNSNFEDDIKANFSGKSITKIESDKAIEKTVANGFTKEQHFEVAKQIKELFEKADKGFYHEDRKSTNEKTGLKRIVRLYADVKLKDNTKAVAYITLRESFENGTKIYTIELMDIKKASENTDAVLDGLTIDNKRNGFLKKKSVHNSSITEYGEKSSKQIYEKLYKNRGKFYEEKILLINPPVSLGGYCFNSYEKQSPQEACNALKRGLKHYELNIEDFDIYLNLCRRDDKKIWSAIAHLKEDKEHKKYWNGMLKYTGALGRYYKANEILDIKENKSLAKEQQELITLLKADTEPMPKAIEFTKDNFDKYFKNGVKTPIEDVKIGENQYKKLEAKSRKEFILPMYETLTKPTAIILTDDNAKMYVKAYENSKNKERDFVSVVVDKGSLHISISSHIEKPKQLIKKMSKILYKKPARTRLTPHDDKSSLDSSITEYGEKSREKQYKYKDTDEHSNKGLAFFDKFYAEDENSDYYGAIKEDKNFDISEYSNVWLAEAIEEFSNQIKYNKEYEQKAIKEYHSMSSRKGKGQDERMAQKKELSEDIQFYKQKQAIIKDGLKKLQAELDKRNKSTLKKSFSSQVNYFKKKIEERLA